MERIIDLGCGPNKHPGAVGFDHYRYAGVDVVGDLDTTPWPFPDDGFDRIIASHVIEHVAAPDLFLAEIHRIARPGAQLEVTTPHFSSFNSWNDPTHRWHYGAYWYEPLLADGYLAPQTGTFACVSTDVSFGNSILEWPALLAIRWRGLRWWEMHHAARWPGKDIRTVLRVVKEPGS